MKYQCPYSPFWDEASTPVIGHIMRLHLGMKIPSPSELQVSGERV